jgi:ribosomal protein S18 acetylase RimI-like enzyme
MADGVYILAAPPPAEEAVAGRSRVHASFEPAGEGDFDALAALVAEFHRESGYAFEAERVRRALRALLRDPALGRAWLVVADGVVAGYGVLTFGWSLEWGGRDAFVDELYLRPQFRGRGLGDSALAFLAGEALSLGVMALHLEVERGNETGQRLYRRRGFAGNERQILSLRLG